MPVPQDVNVVDPVRSLDDIALVGSDLLNAGGVAEGSQSPPEQHGPYRIPAPKGVHVISQTYDPAILASTFVIGWLDVVDSADGLNQAKVAGYRVYAKLAISNNPNPTLVGESPNSPCYATVVSDQASSQVTFYVQPYLSSGQTLPVTACPTTTGTTPTPFYEFSDGGISVIIDQNRPVGGGFTQAGLGVVEDAHPNHTTTIGPGFVVGLNGNGKKMFILGSNGASPNQKGTLQLYDGTDTGGISGNGNRVVADGGQGHIQVKGVSSGNPGLIELMDDSGSDIIITSVNDITAPIGTNHYLHVTLGGVACRILVQELV